MASTRPSQRQLVEVIRATLADLLPMDWTAAASPGVRSDGPDLLVTISAPDGTESVVMVAVRLSITVRDVRAAVGQVRRFADQTGRQDAIPMIAAPYLSETTRERIADEGASYADSTGNVLLRGARPAVYVRQDGARKDPWPADESLRSLKGRGAGRAVRALLDHAPPYGIRELAARADVALGSLSRTVDLLDREGLITRARRGPISALDLAGVLHRWAKDYDVIDANRVSTYLAPRGLSVVVAKLRSRVGGYAATGAFAAQWFDPVAATRLGAMYVDDVTTWAKQLDLRLTETGANVWLLEPYDDVVFKRTTDRQGIVCVCPTQLAVDLITGPGRDPSQGEALIEWMRAHEDAWRTR